MMKSRRDGERASGRAGVRGGQAGAMGARGMGPGGRAGGGHRMHTCFSDPWAVFRNVTGYP